MNARFPIARTRRIGGIVVACVGTGVGATVGVGDGEAEGDDDADADADAIGTGDAVGDASLTREDDGLAGVRAAGVEHAHARTSVATSENRRAIGVTLPTTYPRKRCVVSAPCASCEYRRVTGSNASGVTVMDVAPGLWIWRLEHPGWRPEVDWQKVVTSVCVDSGSTRWLIDPLLPADDAHEVWDRLDAQRPTAVAIVLPDHVREVANDRGTWSVDALVERYGATAYGPSVLDPPQIPKTILRTIEPGHELPGGIVPFRDPRGWDETPLWLPAQRTIVFGDTLTERNGALRVWMSPTHAERAVPDLRALLELPVERVIISHGEPVHDRAELERALERPPWPASELHLNAYRGDVARVRRLVEGGADVNARDEQHHGTVLDWARMGGHRDVIEYLEALPKRG